jgi:hypothetical protein
MHASPPFPIKASWDSYAQEKRIGYFLDSDGAEKILSWGEDPAIASLRLASDLSLTTCARRSILTNTVNLYTSTLWHIFFQKYQPIDVKTYPKNIRKHITTFSSHLVGFFLNTFDPTTLTTTALVQKAWGSYLSNNSPYSSRQLFPTEPFTVMQTNLQAVTPNPLSTAEELELNVGEYIIKQLSSIRTYHSFDKIMATLGTFLNYLAPIPPQATAENICRTYIVDSTLKQDLLNDGASAWTNTFAFKDIQTLDFLIMNGTLATPDNDTRLLFGVFRKHYLASSTIKTTIGPYNTSSFSATTSIISTLFKYLVNGSNRLNHFTSLIYYKFLFDLELIPDNQADLNALSNRQLLHLSTSQYVLIEDYMEQTRSSSHISSKSFSNGNVGTIYGLGGWAQNMTVLDPSSNPAMHANLRGYPIIYNSKGDFATSIDNGLTAIKQALIDPTKKNYTVTAAQGNYILDLSTIHSNALSTIQEIIQAIHTVLTPLRQRKLSAQNHSSMLQTYSDKIADYSQTFSTNPSHFHQRHTFPTNYTLGQGETLFNQIQDSAIASAYANKRGVESAKSAQAQTQQIKDQQAASVGTQDADSLANAAYAQQLSNRAEAETQIQQRISAAGNDTNGNAQQMSLITDLLSTVKDSQDALIKL